MRVYDAEAPDAPSRAKVLYSYTVVSSLHSIRSASPDVHSGRGGIGMGKEMTEQSLS